MTRPFGHRFLIPAEEIAILAVSPAGNNAADEGAQKDQATLAFIDANKGSPFVDQQEATKLAGELMIGEDRTQRLMTPMKDPNVEAIATRDQLIEFGQMMGGEAMPVSGTDNHEIHMKVIGVKTAP